MSLERPPHLTADQIRALARDAFGLELLAAADLPGERDRNLRLDLADGRRALLKISGPAADPALLELQRLALERIREADPSLPTPRLIKTPSGGAEHRFDGAGAPCQARLFEFLPGRVLADVRPHTPQLLGRIGAAFARLDRALEGLEHPCGRRPLEWDLLQAEGVAARTAAVQNPERRARVDAIFDAHASRLRPALEALPRQLIHNDGNDHNILVAVSPEPRRLEVSGLLDFGDMIEAPRVCELAIAAAYAMLDKPQPLDALCALTAGYHAIAPLSAEELDLVFGLVQTRLAVSVTLSAERARRHPQDPYLTISEAPAWALLERLGGIAPGWAAARLRAACRRPVHSARPAFDAWLEGREAPFAPVLGRHLDALPWTLLDLGLDGDELAPLAEPKVGPALTALIADTLERREVAVGVASYNITRALYTAPAFSVEGNDGPEGRVVHLGVDLFAAEETEVHAPCSGRVHSFADNAGPLDYGPTIILEHRPSDGPVFYSLYGHLSRGSLEGLEPGAAIAAGQAFARLGGPEVNGGWPPHLHFQLFLDLFGRRGDAPGVCRLAERAAWIGLCPDPSPLLGLPASPRDPSGCSDRLLRRRRARLAPSYSLSYSEPLEIVRGFGARLYDRDGRAYLDAVNNIAHVGHGHPAVVAAGRRQMGLLNTNTRYLHRHLIEYAERLIALFPEPLDTVFFVCSGSEANELALRLARSATGRRGALCIDGAYHGNTAALIDVSPYKFAGPGGGGRPDHVRVLPRPDAFRGPLRDAPELIERCASAADAAIAELPGGPAAFIAESALGCGGQIILPAGYLAAHYQRTRAAGGLCIADEVQVGFGRLGEAFWGFQTQGVVPDIVTLGKPMGNGHPLAGVVTTRAIAEAFANGMEYFNSFGGNPVSCAIGLAVLDVIDEEGLQARARDVGAALKSALLALAERHPLIGEVRGLGLFLGVELVEEERRPAAAQARYVAERLRQRGVLMSVDGPDHNVLKIKPPLAFSEADAGLIAASLDAVLSEEPARASS